MKMKPLNEVQLLLFRELDMALEVKRQLDAIDAEFAALVTTYWRKCVNDLGESWDHAETELAPGVWLEVGKRSCAPGDDAYDEENWLVFGYLAFGESYKENSVVYWLELFTGRIDESRISIGVSFTDLVSHLGDRALTRSLTADLERTLKENGFKEVPVTRAAKFKLLFERELVMKHDALLAAFESGEYDEAFAPIAEGLEFIQTLGPEIDRIIAEAKRMKAKQPQGAGAPGEAR